MSDHDDLRELSRQIIERQIGQLKEAEQTRRAPVRRPLVTKFLEIRDRGTLIPALAVSISATDSPIARRGGFGDTPCILLTNLARLATQYDPYEWDLRYGRTMKIAHMLIRDGWEDLVDGDVIDVEYLLGETSVQKTKECV